jgi:hypothetical protein
MHNADRWEAFANGIVQDLRRDTSFIRSCPVLIAFDRTPVAKV